MEALTAAAGQPHPAGSIASLPSVDALIARYVGEGLVSGIVVAWQQGGAPVRFACAGEPAFHAGRPVDADSLFRIFSMTKPITGIATMMLIEDGRLALDQPLHSILPEFADARVMIDGDPARTRPAARPITIRHLLTHTAGLGYHNAGDGIASLYIRNGLTPGTRDRIRGPGELAAPGSLAEMGSRLARLPLVTDPGTRFEYSIAIDVLGLVVETVSGMPFETFLQQRLFDPLGMADTAFVVPTERLGRLTALVERRGEAWKFVDDPAHSVYARPALPSGGGGLVSSARDYARFAALLVNEGELDGKRLLKPETVRLARSNLLPDGVDHIELPLGYTWPGIGFGAAMSVQVADGEAPAGVFGWPGAAGTGCWIDPARRFFLVFMTQYWPPEINVTMRPEIIAAAYRDLSGQG